MDCSEVRPRLQQFLDNQLIALDAEAVEVHVSECEACWQSVSSLRVMEMERDMEVQLSDLHGRYEPVDLPEDFTDLVMQRIHDERPKGVNVVWPWLRQRWSRRQYASVAYAMSATLVVVSAGNLLFLWNESSSLLTTWGIRLQAYQEATGAYLGAAGDYLGIFWNGLIHLFNFM